MEVLQSSMLHFLVAVNTFQQAPSLLSLCTHMQAELGSKLGSVDAKVLEHIGSRLAHTVCGRVAK